MTRKRTDEEKRYAEVLASCVLKANEHTQKEVVSGLGKGLPRFYTVTTFASSPRYGGERTPIVCSSFDSAKRVVEENIGDIWECSYDLCVISAFYMDCMYGTPWVMRENLSPDVEVTYISTEGQTCISGQALEQESYWYMWVKEGGDGRYMAIERPQNFHGGGPVG